MGDPFAAFDAPRGNISGRTGDRFPVISGKPVDTSGTDPIAAFGAVYPNDPPDNDEVPF